MLKHFRFLPHGNIIQILPLTPFASEWITQNVPHEEWQRFDGGVAVYLEAFGKILKQIKKEF